MSIYFKSVSFCTIPMFILSKTSCQLVLVTLLVGVGISNQNKNKKIIKSIRKWQLQFLGHIKRRQRTWQTLENSRKKKKVDEDKIKNIWTDWPKMANELTANIKDSSEWRSNISASQHTTKWINSDDIQLYIDFDVITYLTSLLPILWAEIRLCLLWCVCCLRELVSELPMLQRLLVLLPCPPPSKLLITCVYMPSNL